MLLPCGNSTQYVAQCRVTSDPVEVRLREAARLAQFSDEVDSDGTRVPSAAYCRGGVLWAKSILADGTAAQVEEAETHDQKERKEGGGEPLRRTIRISKALSSILRREGGREMKKGFFAPLRSVFSISRLRPDGATRGNILSIVA